MRQTTTVVSNNIDSAVRFIRRKLISLLTRNLVGRIRFENSAAKSKIQSPVNIIDQQLSEEIRQIQSRFERTWIYFFIMLFRTVWKKQCRTTLRRVMCTDGVSGPRDVKQLFLNLISSTAHFENMFFLEHPILISLRGPTHWTINGRDKERQKIAMILSCPLLRKRRFLLKRPPLTSRPATVVRNDRKNCYQIAHK